MSSFVPTQSVKVRSGSIGHDNLEEKQYEVVDGNIEIFRNRTTIEKDTMVRRSVAHEYVETLPQEDSLPDVKQYVPRLLNNALFCGHLVTDLDSIAGAIGAAELYEGVPARASEINSETAFALKLWGVEKPEPIEELLETYPEAGVCLVDHQQTSQLNKSIKVERIVGVIDHHALQNATIVTDMPIYIDIRPWGSMSTIIAHTFLTLRRRPKKATAGMLLCAILSDTLNLQGPTTTDWDRLMVAVLVEIAQVEDVQFLATQQFKAKSAELAGLTPMALCHGDQKTFSFKTDMFEGSIGFAVVETTDDDVIMSRSAEILAALEEDKKNKGLTVLYMAVVNIVLLRSNLLMIGPDEISLATASFPKGTIDSPNVMNLGSMVSRKKDFIPALTTAIKHGFTLKK
mmetsp:Transcript_2251/g.2347  ORF Transcript_2251/g.2347 Transcript_2251/m.2347 type:complete len:401 (+) Transcript_2251:53-1255(+)|eukprot:CAMPEP_0182417640 /NCGR_PEP_ID=MMETSP1167-20130531/2089_1 /TAXON_ID=2988 /ORGANISM="Mallomonas Sp, Strain CCMP3275" /LENGTH=400 /DNA_ID=CAMNT_0024591341 /DNA_START=45 /DNA_END=1247 /DNA_ORIENTATION=-